MTRSVLVVAHTGRPDARVSATEVVRRLHDAGIHVRVLVDEVVDLDSPGVQCVSSPQRAAAGCELVIGLGGDGTLLRAAEAARMTDTPVLGINLGHVGFLAEAESGALAQAVDSVVQRTWDVEERMTLDVTVRNDGEVTGRTWALNEASVEKASRQRMIELVVEVDGRPLSRWGCDGVICATPTGSTAYAFSAGGPVVWPQVEALLVVPLSAHALFARPLVVAPESAVAVEVSARTRGHGVLWCDGRRTVDLVPGARIEITRGAQPVRLARLHQAPFTDRLVAKFDLPVEGWRGRAVARRASAAGGSAVRAAGDDHGARPTPG